MFAIRSEAFEPYAELQSYQAQLPQGHYGATAVFVGTMRDFNDGDSIQAMHLSCYAEMLNKYLSDLITRTAQQWQIIDCLLLHRIGDITPNDTIVLVAVWASHRGDAFSACHYLMEQLKQNAPFWKKELLNNQQYRWVEKNTDGYKK